MIRCDLIVIVIRRKILTDYIISIQKSPHFGRQKFGGILKSIETFR